MERSALRVIQTILLLVTAASADEPRKAVPISSVPTAAQKTIHSHLGNGKLGEITLDSNGDGKFYSIQFTRAGREQSFTVTEDGRLRSKEITLAEAPPAVQKAIKENIGKSALLSIEQNFDSGDFSYEIAVTADGGERFFTVAKDGALSSKEVSIEETPAAVRKTIESQVGPGTLLRIDQTHGDDGVEYTVDARQDGSTRSFSVSESGSLLGVEVEVSELPPAVKKSLDDFRGQSSVKGVEKQFDGGEITWDVKLAKSGEERESVFGDDGTLLSTEVKLAELPAPVQKTIVDHLDGGEARKINRLVDGELSSYQVEIGGGRNGEFSVGQDGAFLSKRVSLESTPQPVQNTIRQNLHEGALLRIDQLPDEDGGGYNVDAKLGGKTRSFSVAESGALLSIELDVSALPPAVKKAVDGVRGQGAVESVEEQFNGAEITWDVQIAKNGGRHELTLGSDGTLQSIETDLADTPPPVQKSIAAHLDGGVLAKITRIVEGDSASFEVEVGGARKREFSIAEDGTFSSERMSLEQTPPAVQKAIKDAVRSAKIVGIEQTLEDGVATYNVEARLYGKTHAFSVADDGSIVSVEIDFDSLPPAVQKSTEALGGRKNLKLAEKQFEGADVSYDVIIAKGGEDREYVFGADGAPQSMEVNLAETPASVQKAIPERLKGGVATKITRLIDGASTTYVVEVGGDRKGEFSLDELGAFLGERVNLEATPPAPRRTIEETVGGGKILRIDQTLDADGVSYSVEAKLHGKRVSFSVADDGMLVSIETDFPSLPPAVQKAVNTLRGKSAVKSVEKQFDGAEVSYDVKIVDGRVERDFNVGPDGTLVSLEVALAETPPPVQKTIQEHLGKGALETIDRVVDGMLVTFDVTVGGAEKGEFLVGSDGAFLSSRVNLEQTTPGAQKTIRDYAGSAKIVRIDQSWSEKVNGVFPYDVHCRKDGKNFEFNVGPKGKYLGAEE